MYHPAVRLGGFLATDLVVFWPGVFVSGQIWTTPSYQIGWHTNPSWEIYLQMAGRTSWEIRGEERRRQQRQSPGLAGGPGGGEVFELEAGGVYLIAPGVEHRLTGASGEKMHFYFAIYTPDEVLPEGVRGEVLGGWPGERFALLRNGWAIQAPFAALIRELCLQDRLIQPALRAHLTALTVECVRLLRAAPNRRAIVPTAHPAAVQARELLAGRPEHAWRLEELAGLTGLSQQRLIQVFRQDFAETPKQFLQRMRLERSARQLRETDLPITEVALENGFGSSQHFATAFRQAYGCSPRSYRQAGTEGREAADEKGLRAGVSERS